MEVSRRPRNVLSSWSGCQLWPGPQAPRRHFLCPWPPPPHPHTALYTHGVDRAGTPQAHRMTGNPHKRGRFPGKDGSGGQMPGSPCALSPALGKGCSAHSVSTCCREALLVPFLPLSPGCRAGFTLWGVCPGLRHVVIQVSHTRRVRLEVTPSRVHRGNLGSPRVTTATLQA